MLYDQSCGRFAKNIKRRKQSKVIDNIAKKYGHEVIRLLPYHCDLNAIELIWADEKDCVARENREMTVKSVEALFRERRSQITAEKCKKCIEHVKKVELSCGKTDRIIDKKKWTNLKSHWMQMRMKVTSKQTVRVTKMKNKQNSLNRYIFMFIFFFYYPAHNTFYFRFYGF